PASESKVLIVDDNREYALIMSKLLRLKGFDVVTEFDGLSALTTVENFEPEVILLDIGLPGLDGYQVCERIRAMARGEDMVIIAVSGWGQDSSQPQAQAARFDAHLTKPISQKEIGKVLATCLPRPIE